MENDFIYSHWLLCSMVILCDFPWLLPAVLNLLHKMCVCVCVCVCVILSARNSEMAVVNFV
jgi:hypothetical protein